MNTKVETIIKELISTSFGGDNASQGKAVQLLKGLAFSDDPASDKFMQALDKWTSELSLSDFESDEKAEKEEQPDGDEKDANNVRGESVDSNQSFKDFLLSEMAPSIKTRATSENIVKALKAAGLKGKYDNETSSIVRPAKSSDKFFADVDKAIAKMEKTGVWTTDRVVPGTSIVTYTGLFGGPKNHVVIEVRYGSAADVGRVFIKNRIVREV